MIMVHTRMVHIYFLKIIIFTKNERILSRFVLFVKYPFTKNDNYKESEVYEPKKL